MIKMAVSHAAFCSRKLTLQPSSGSAKVSCSFASGCLRAIHYGHLSASRDDRIPGFAPWRLPGENWALHWATENQAAIDFTGLVSRQPHKHPK